MNPVANKNKKENYIKCKKYGTEIHFEKRGSLTPCKCGAISVDGSNKNLTNARRAKNDEFYTQYIDIQKVSSLRHILQIKYPASICLLNPLYNSYQEHDYSYDKQNMYKTSDSIRGDHT